MKPRYGTLTIGDILQCYTMCVLRCIVLYIVRGQWGQKYRGTTQIAVDEIMHLTRKVPARMSPMDIAEQ